MVPSGTDLSGWRTERPIGAEQALAAALAQEAEEAGGRSPYDVTLIDGAPSLGLVTVAALTAADEALVPIKVGGLDM
ncbi:MULTISPECIES: AAA family ATPase [unclassified Streptomyces]|uniref:ParA family protein n=1 Tax=unclassified Streptomyces TaxID=2593676 RepID=UPI001F083246